MKRLISLMLCLALAVGLAVPALAAEGEQPDPAPAVDTPVPEKEPAAGEAEAVGQSTAADPADEPGIDGALEDLALKVKQTLDVDDDYSAFSSDYYDGPSPLWSLYWSDDARQLTVEARPDGTVVNMYRWDNGGKSERFYGFDPAFPSITMDEATAQAQTWCEKLFSGEESGRLDEQRIYLGSSGYYRFEGTVLKNSLESPITFSMVIDGTGMTSFYRSDRTEYVGELPEPAEGDEAAAQAALAGAVELELRWVSDGKGAARLMYIPVGPRTIVDPVTGETVDMDALYEDLGENGAGYAYSTDAAAEEAEMPMADAGGTYLTEMEQSSIDNYGDVLDQNAIDEALRALDALGLEDFQLVRCSYSMDAATGDVNAAVRYTGTMTGDKLYGYSQDAFDAAAASGQDMTIYKYFSLDAKTGELKSLSTNYPIWDERESDTDHAAQADLAEQFIALAAPELAGQVAGCTLKGYDEDDELTFAQVYEGYFYPDNRIEVHVDPDSGVVDQYWYTWDEDVAFGPAEDIIDADEALAAYTGALELVLGYVAWPIDVLASDDPLYASYAQWGYTYVERLCLAYYYSGMDSVEGVDAVTGEAAAVRERDDAYIYGDLDDTPNAHEIETLGLAGVGFSGGRFLPEAQLTRRDAVTLLLRAGGSYAPEANDEWLGELAYNQGFISGGDFKPLVTVGRMEFLRMLIGASRYGYALELDGVWDAGFEDVDAADEGVAAIARALGLASGTKLEPDEILTRAGAAALLYRFMER